MTLISTKTWKNAKTRKKRPPMKIVSGGTAVEAKGVTIAAITKNVDTDPDVAKVEESKTSLIPNETTR